MFTRTIELLNLGMVAAVMSLSIASLAHAQITKCVDVDGSVIYSNTSCGNATAIGVVDGKTAQTSDTTQFKLEMTVSSDRGQLRETAWTHRNTPAAKKVLDKLTIRDAREALTASDRAVAFLRQQTLAANN